MLEPLQEDTRALWGSFCQESGLLFVDVQGFPQQYA